MTAVTYRHVNGNVRTHYCECDACGSEVADEKNVLQNKREWVRFKKVVDRVPMGHEILAMRRSLGLTQAEAGTLFGGGPVAFSKYENDDLVPDEAMSNLLYVSIHFPESVAILAGRKGIALPKLPCFTESYVGAGDESHTWKMVPTSRVSFVSTDSYSGVDRRQRQGKASSYESDFMDCSFSNGAEERWSVQ